MHRGRLSAHINERCEQGRIRRTTIGGIFRPDRHAFLRSSRWVCCRSPRSSSDRHRFHAKGKGEMSEYAEGGAAWISLASGNTGHLPRGI